MEPKNEILLSKKLLSEIIKEAHINGQIYSEWENKINDDQPNQPDEIVYTENIVKELFNKSTNEK